MRIGGVQHLAACGIDVWRIQALARHSSNAILAYLDGVHTRNLGNIAAEAALGRSLATMRAELKALQEHASRAATKADLSRAIASSASPRACTKPEEVLLEHAPAPEGTGDAEFVTAPGGKVHIIRHTSPSLTWCNWHWPRHGRAKTFAKEPAGDMCKRCTQAAMHDTFSSSSNE